jgi:hypothetical protein
MQLNGCYAADLYTTISSFCLSLCVSAVSTESKDDMPSFKSFPTAADAAALQPLEMPAN